MGLSGRLVHLAVSTSRRVVGLPLVMDRLGRVEGRLNSISDEISRLAKVEDWVALETERAKRIEQLSALNEQCLAQLNGLRTQSALDRPLAFMHIPKTSGTAVIDGLREVLPATPCTTGVDLSTFGSFRSFETADPLALKTLVRGALPPTEGTDFVTGHIAYSTLARSRPNARFMTILREPRSRILSLWMYWRSLSDDALRYWGAWTATVRLARRPLADFLDRPEAACHTDNVAVRMLLWPHPRIPDGGFIDSADDERLGEEAAARLKSFAFADVIENPQFEENLRTFLARPFVYRRVNETRTPPELRTTLQDELTGDALRLLELRSRLDRRLWLMLAAERVTTAGDDIFGRTVARYAASMSTA